MVIRSYNSNYKIGIVGNIYQFGNLSLSVGLLRKGSPQCYRSVIYRENLPAAVSFPCSEFFGISTPVTAICLLTIKHLSSRKEDVWSVACDSQDSTKPQGSFCSVVDI